MSDKKELIKLSGDDEKVLDEVSNIIGSYRDEQAERDDIYTIINKTNSHTVVRMHQDVEIDDKLYRDRQLYMVPNTTAHKLRYGG